MTTTLTSKGQVTVPKKIRDYLGLQPGSAVTFSLGTGGEVIVRPAEATPVLVKGRLRNLRGTLVTGRTTNALMSMLRDYPADTRDPGLK